MSEGIRDYNRVGGGEGGKEGQHKSEKTQSYMAVHRYLENQLSNTEDK